MFIYVISLQALTIELIRWFVWATIYQTTPQEIIDMMKLKKPTKPHKVMTLLQEDELRKYYQHIMYIL